MAGIFSNCGGIKSIDLSNFELSANTNIYPMFLVVII